MLGLLYVNMIFDPDTTLAEFHIVHKGMLCTKQCMWVPHRHLLAMGNMQIPTCLQCFSTVHYCSRL